MTNLRLFFEGPGLDGLPFLIGGLADSEDDDCMCEEEKQAEALSLCMYVCMYVCTGGA